MSRVISQHPALSTVFLDADAQRPHAKPRFAQLPQLDLRDCVTFVEQAPTLGTDEDAAPAAVRNPEWDQFVERYHNTRFDDRWGELPLWRLVISRRQQQKSPGNSSHGTEFVACFIYLHAICDGRSGPAFHRAFLAELQSISQQRGLADDKSVEEHHHDYPQYIVRSPNAPPLPSIEALHRLPLSPTYLAKMAWQDTFPAKKKNVWLGGPISAQPTTPSRFRSMTLSADVTRNLVAVSRSHSASLTATVHVLVGNAILANLPPKGTTTTTTTPRLKSGIAVSLRRFLPRDVVTDDSMGNWVYIAYYDGPCITQRSSSPPSTTSASPRISWQDAQDVKKMLDNEIRREGKNTPLGCLQWAGNMHKFFEGRVKQPRDGSYLLSNLGEFKPRDDDDSNSNRRISSDDNGARSRAAAAEPTHDNINNNNGNWKTGRMVFSEGFDAAGEAIQVTMITGCDGCLTVGFVWNDTVVEESLVLGIFDTLEKLMIETAQDAKT